MGAIQIQDGRSTIIPALILGVAALPVGQVLVVSSIPSLGNIYKDGVALSITDTITVQEIIDNKLTFLSSSGTLGVTTFGFDSDAYEVTATLVVGKVGSLYVIAKTKAPTLLVTDDIPRAIPPLLMDKLAYGLASRMLERGDRQSDDAMAIRAGNRYEDAKLETIAAINSFGGNFDTIDSI